MSVTWSELGLQGNRKVRDLWRQKELSAASGKFASRVNRHGVTLVRIR
jgi:hypothetical protein